MPTEPSEDPKSVPDRSLLETAGEIGVNTAGAVGGAALALVSGDPIFGVLGALGGTAISGVINEVLSRQLSRRQKLRTERVVEAAGRKFALDGIPIRNDGFFTAQDGERSSGQETVEGLLLAAQQSYEESKLPYLANLLAFISTTPVIDPITASRLIRTAESLSWTQYQLVALFGKADQYELPDRSFVITGGTLEEISVARALGDIADLFGSNQSEFTPNLKLQLINNSMAHMRLRLEGQLLYDGLGLAEMPVENLDMMFEILTEPERRSGVPF
jgi:hypothetical protein